MHFEKALGPELKRANVLSDPLSHQMRSVAEVARPEFRFHPANLLALQHAAGNHAVTGLVEPRRAVQRDVGWSDASEEGYKWNAKDGRRDVGQIKRIPLEGLTEGLKDDKAFVSMRDKVGKGRHTEVESTMIPKLSPESAKGRAIVLVHSLIDSNRDVEVVVFLHGHTEDPTKRPFAGWRALTAGAQKRGSAFLRALRKGFDAADVAPVRDVALDQAEQQLEESKSTQTIMVSPQGGLHSQFGKSGGYSFDSATYVNAVVNRLLTEKVLKAKANGDPPTIGRLSLAGHSGAGATLSHMAAASAELVKAGKPATISGDLVLFDAINEGQSSGFIAWAEARLTADLAELTTRTEQEQLKYLAGAQKLRGYHTATEVYVTEYGLLQTAIDNWFVANANKLGPIAPCLYGNFYVDRAVKLEHEELMRGVHAGTDRAPGEGKILDALNALHGGAAASPTSCLPADLAEQWEKVLSRMPKPKPTHAAPKEKEPAAVGH